MALAMATGDESSTPHLDRGALLASADERTALLDQLAGHGLRLRGVDCSAAWLLHPAGRFGAARMWSRRRSARLGSRVGRS